MNGDPLASFDAWRFDVDMSGFKTRFHQQIHQALPASREEALTSAELAVSSGFTPVPTPRDRRLVTSALTAMSSYRNDVHAKENDNLEWAWWKDAPGAPPPKYDLDELKRRLS